jgi:hypothetical protein
MAMASDLVRAEVIDAEEFPALSQRYNVAGVPKTSRARHLSRVPAAPAGLAERPERVVASSNAPRGAR